MSARRHSAKMLLKTATEWEGDMDVRGPIGPNLVQASGSYSASVPRPPYRFFGASGPLRDLKGAVILKSDGLGAARGQRFRKGPCASHPTRQYLL